MKDQIANVLSIKSDFVTKDDEKYLIKDVDTIITINENNSDIFLEHNLSFENCSFGEFCIKDKKDERRIKGIKFINCDFNDIKLENTSYSDM